ncbi:hypothetical protein ACFQGT_00410 [Natrialbaceae archaeon GCM10025810]
MPYEIQFDKPVGIDVPEGGEVFWNGEESRLPETFGRTPTGALLGPIEFGVPQGGTLELEDLTFMPGEDDDSWLSLSTTAPFAAAPVAANSETAESVTLGRRGVLTLIGAIAGATMVAGPAVAQEDEDDTISLHVATATVESADAPWSIRILDIVDEVLPPSTEILVDQDATRVGKIAEADEAVTLRPETGEVRVYIRDSLGMLTQILAWARSFLPGDTSLTFRRTFPDGNQASDYEVGEYVKLTEHPAIVNSVEDSGQDRTVFTIGDTQIPHVDEGETTEAGAWDLVGDGLVYEVGENPPAEEEWEVRTDLSLLQSIRY